MGQSADLVLALKRELRARKITYSDVATKLGIAESSVKRMFASGNFTLQRLEAVCAIAEIEYGELVRGGAKDQHLLSFLTETQEAQLVGDPKLFLVAVCLMNLIDFEGILAAYKLSAAELTGYMTKLDRIGFIKLMPGNRYKLLLARTFGWIPNGPMQTLFKRNATDFFRSNFDEDNEMLVFLNVRLADAHMPAFLDRMKRVARDLSDQHAEDASLPLEKRKAISVLMAVRPWQLDFMRALRRG
jgi:DNA-binding Xre family transcriptional regulator